MQEVNKQRDITFDIMKGIGILLVMIGHVYSQYLPNTHHLIYTFHMPMFFLIAGFFSKAYENKASSIASIKKYFVRLVIPMVFTQILFVLWHVLLVFTKGESWTNAIAQFTSLFWADVYCPSTKYGPLSLGVTWFLMALFVSKTLFLFLSRFKLWAIPMSLLIALIAILLHKVFPYSIWCFTLGMTALPFVTFGWIVHNYKIPIWIIVISIACWPIAYLFLGNLDIYHFVWPCWPVNVLAACGATYCIYWLCLWIGKHTRFLSKGLAHLGVASLAIMCVHDFEIGSHLGNHLRVLFGLDLPVGWLYVWRYMITIIIAFALVHIPKVKRIFV